MFNQAYIKAAFVQKLFFFRKYISEKWSIWMKTDIKKIVRLFLACVESQWALTRSLENNGFASFSLNSKTKSQ